MGHIKKEPLIVKQFISQMYPASAFVNLIDWRVWGL